MRNEESTVAAISTAKGIAGIAVVRMSGPDAVNVISKAFRPAKKNDILLQAPSHTIHYGWIYDKNGKRVDEVLVMIMKAPSTYTGEDTIEVNCHGGVYVSSKVLEALFDQGAELAEPGEFSKRAYLNGKMDLTKAEAVMDTIAAETSLSLRLGIAGMSGALFKEIGEIRKALMDLMVEAEVNIDYPEYDVPELSDSQLLVRLKSIFDKANSIYNTSETGRIIKNGIKTVIVGEPNVGKSSLLNMLLGENRAIVTDIPGTTRDIIEEKAEIAGISLVLSDTAGIRRTEDPIEKIGVGLAVSALEEAELVLFVVDSTKEIGEEDKKIFSKIGKRPYIVLLNKTDLEPPDVEAVALALSCEKENIICIAAAKGEGRDNIADKISELFLKGININENSAIISNARQKKSMSDALCAIERAISSLENGFSADIALIDIRAAYDELGVLSGNSVRDELSDQIFSRFCLGK